MSIERETLVRSLFENMHAIKRSLATSSHGCPIPPSQVELLFAIHTNQPVSFKRLAQVLSLTPGAISQQAEGLEQNGYITRTSDEHDRRVQCLNVSKRGSKLLHSIEKRREQMMESLIAGLSDEELAVWVRVQNKIMRHLLDNQTKQEH